MFSFDKVDAESGMPRLPLFEPHVFFWTPWRGEGEVRNAFGKVLRRFKVDGGGQADADHGIMSQHLVFEDGETLDKRWEIVSRARERYIAREIDSDIIAQGGQSGRRFVWSFWTSHPGKHGTLRIKSTVTYSMVSRTTAHSVCVNRWWGWLPMTRVTTVYRHQA